MNLPSRLRSLASLSGQKKSWVWILKFGGLFVVFLLFFWPTYRQYNIVASNINSLRDQIKDLKQISVNLLTPAELKETEQNLQDFEAKLIDSRQAGKLLDFISDAADQNHFNVIQIYSDSPISVKDELGKELEFKGKKLMLLPINFRVETDYKNLGNFLKAVKDNEKGNMVVESLSLKKSSAQSESLQCDVTLSCVVV